MLQKHYKPADVEPALQARWAANGVYHFDESTNRPVYAIDTPPPTVSGHLHLGHAYSYCHADFLARFWRMQGYNVYYPMGYDDNGLPTERLVEKWLGITADQVGRTTFIEKCLEVSSLAEKDYEALWQRLALSIDWRYTYRTIDENARRACQWSFLDLYRGGRAYRQEAPAIWCPTCQTSIAQADLEDLERTTEFVTIPFALDGGGQLTIATTRPELLPACVAVFVHPEDDRYQHQVGRTARVPLFEHPVPVLADPAADPGKGTGAVMCCTFGDTTDIAWWRAHDLPYIAALDRRGHMTDAAGSFAGLPAIEARRQIKTTLAERGLLLERHPETQSVRVHERCDTPVEYNLTKQWFVRLLDRKERYLQAGEELRWYPAHMHGRYKAWVENLNWDWCISRQRYFGVPFPVWYCADCGEVLLPDEERLPVDPLMDEPEKPCPACGSTGFLPEQDIFDTWMTSSVSPLIASGWHIDPERFTRLFPMTLRPQAHEIIRTWTFYTVVKSIEHFGRLPWRDVCISGWGIAGEGMGKISKSRGGGPMAPLEMVERYSADAVRYWAASTGPGKDAVINEEKIQLGLKFTTKLWNVARFSGRFLAGDEPRVAMPELSQLTPADRWLLSKINRLVQRVTGLFERYEYAAARYDVENFFWNDLADNYLEMAKQRLYASDNPGNPGARYTLHTVLLTTLKLLAPILPHITEALYLELYQETEGSPSLHTSPWPAFDERWLDDSAEGTGELLVEIATGVRRYKSERNLSPGAPLSRLQLATGNDRLAATLRAAIPDLQSITRAAAIQVLSALPEPGDFQVISADLHYHID
jgi:valyl-tRNA synthetase